MNKREIVTAAVLEIAAAAAPDVKWANKLTGANRSREKEGSVTCDRVEYIYKAKGMTFAEATFSIYLIDVNSVDGVDGLADAVFDALHDSDLNGTCIKALVTKVQYGAAKDYPSVGIALLSLDVQYQI